MVLSNFLKAKLSSIPNGVASLLTPSLDWTSGKPPPSCLHLTTRRGDSSYVGGPVKGSLSNDVRDVCIRVELWVLSLSMEEGISTFGLMAGIWPNFKGLTKVSGVATNHWVFLRYD